MVSTARWILLRFSFEPTHEAAMLWGTTDESCHLTARYTEVEPHKHTKALLKRGKPYADDVRWCFVKFKELEQKDAGDTKQHNFKGDDWPVCTKRWTYLLDLAAERESPSVSPILEYHNVGIQYDLVLTEPWAESGPPGPPMARVFEETWTS